jgi:hypothetical protein
MKSEYTWCKKLLVGDIEPRDILAPVMVISWLKP